MAERQLIFNPDVLYHTDSEEAMGVSWIFPLSHDPELAEIHNRAPKAADRRMGSRNGAVRRSFTII